MKATFMAIVVFVVCPCVFGQMACPSGSEDILNYFTMGDPNRLNNYMGPGNANPIYTTMFPDLGTSFAASGYFVWTKSPVGYPWDIKAFDQQYVYDRTTELSWTDPTTFKRFVTDLPLSRRCVKVGKGGGTIKISASATNYSFYGNCQVDKTQNLGYVVNTISAPTSVDTGGNLGTVTTRYLKYKYSCDSTYSNCAYKEVFSLGYQVGLYDWKYYKNQNGAFVLAQESIINQFASGAATPYLPCTNSYQ